jgi:hypothetical protein
MKKLGEEGNECNDFGETMHIAVGFDVRRFTLYKRNEKK